MLPTPPVLKTTIIQLNKELDSDENNYEILTNDYLDKSPSGSSLDIANKSSMQSRKKRRRSSANVDQEELAKRKHETKQLHSIIEKKRRIKINREFEALKYLIPACRTTTASSSNSPTIKPFNKQLQSSSNNGNKIDGMYKLTILKSSVEYILYLHHIIQKQHDLLTSSNINYDFDVDFARIPLDVNQYRDIDKDFNFKSLVNDLDPLNRFNINTIHESKDDEDDMESDESSTQLPSPDVTPDMAPILTLLNKYTSNLKQLDRLPNIAHQHHLIRKLLIPVSPFTNPIKSNATTPLLSGKQKKRREPGIMFALPDPAINPASALPKNSDLQEEEDGDNERRLSDQDACGTLLALRRSNIDSLLN